MRRDREGGRMRGKGRMEGDRQTQIETDRDREIKTDFLAGKWKISLRLRGFIKAYVIYIHTHIYKY